VTGMMDNKDDRDAPQQLMEKICQEVEQLVPPRASLVKLLAQFRTATLEQEKWREELHRLAFYDAVTGLPNRACLQQEANKLLLHLQQQQQLAVVVIDLDRFRQFNDSMGFPAGDELLQQVAQHLRSFRQQGGIVGHLSGDDFILLQPYQAVDELTLLAERLINRLSCPCDIEGARFKPSFSLGISVYPDDGQDLDVLIFHADMAMRQARQTGRGQFRFFSRELDRLAQESLLLERALQTALEENQLELYYQPQVTLDNGTFFGVEALTRWNHPQLGRISPDRFIPLAEECGLMGRLSEWVLHAACSQLACWRNQGLSIPAIAINLSPSDFHRPELPELISRALNDQGLKPQDLLLEITENVLLDCRNDSLKVLHQLHQSGIRLALDDFGTGYSSLSYLHRLPIHELKLDRSFIQDIERNTASRALCEALVHIGRNLELTVIVEGVETLAQRDLLMQQGYRLAQGYLFAPPLSADEFVKWLTRPGY
jgi:diguanylate cyclase (GGDEF)-like protein